MRLPEKERRTIVEVLSGLMAVEIGSSTLPTKTTEQLLRDVAAIPRRYCKALLADEQFTKRYRRRKRKLTDRQFAKILRTR